LADSALTPQLALDHLGELSSDIRASVLIDASGALAASAGVSEQGADRLRELALELFGHADQAAAADFGPLGQVEVTTPEGAVFGVRAPAARGDWTLAIITGRFALSSLMFYDARKVLGELRAEAA